ncbi:tRNA pseudouridine(55) synthase TruB [Fontivita pretiosa]|uniref:tRNA pseudouridine(55) synthase TruB n=1 Tax=Fontivita pretiosa TaxID=2989684 RepID=UPI003D16915F
MTEGLLILDKPASISSAQAVDRVKRLLPRGTKVGHAGTLDPFATGVLVLLIGGATRHSQRIMDMPKTYEARIRLGATTITDDIESPERPWEPVPMPPSREQIEQAIQSFVGLIQQRPPVYSAIKLSGRRACDRARRGATVQLEPRPVRIYSIEVLDYAWPDLNMRIECARGTYIRALARDLGEKLNVGGYLTALRRTRVGPFDIQQAVPLESLTSQNIHQHIRAAEW